MTAPMSAHTRMRSRKAVAISISVLVFLSFAALGWVAAEGRTTAHNLKVEASRSQIEDKEHLVLLCNAVNRKVLIPLGQAAIAQVPTSLSTFASLIESTDDPGQRAAFEQARIDYLIGVNERSKLYEPLDCKQPLEPQLPNGKGT